MPRIARVVVPNYPHHITQRGNRRQRVFFCDGDYVAYLKFISAALEESETEIWAYCLMPNHVHLVAVPKTVDGLYRLFKEAHVRYTRRINKREGWQGHLWQERFNSSVMDENYLLATVRYDELNPVRANLCSRPEDWPWSSVHAHMRGEDDRLVTVKPMLDLVNGSWHSYLGYEDSEEIINQIRKHNNTGRPLGGETFIKKMEELTGRDLRKKKPGPRPKR